MKVTKQEVLDVMSTLPDETTTDEAFYHLLLLHKIKVSEEEFKNGDFITLEEFNKELEEKYESYLIE